MKKLIAIFALAMAVSGAVTALADLPEIEGVFGISPVNATTAFAVWVPLEEGEAISGVTWYNSDGQITFPELRAVAGDPGHPELMDEAVTVAQNFFGATQQWSDVQFGQPIASASSGLYLMFLLPEGSGFTQAGSGGGVGFGYVAGAGVKRCWGTPDGISWQAFNGEFQIAVEVQMLTNKSGDILVLEKPNQSEVEELVQEMPERFAQSIVAVPNPFNPETEIRFSLPVSCQVEIGVYDISGRLVRQLTTEAFDAGPHSVTWNGKDQNGRGVASGVYMARLVAPQIEMTTRMVLVQ